MKKLFIETTGFTREITARANDQQYAALQQQLQDNPEVGEVIKGCGGLRKLRLADPRRGKGKRGGARVIYLHVPGPEWILLLDVYDKGEKDDLTPQQKKMLKRLAEEFKAASLRSTRGKNR